LVLAKEVLITLKSVQWIEKESSETELITRGTAERTPDGGGVRICYEESAATGFDGCKTVLTCYGDDMATMTRDGGLAFSSDFVIEKGKKHHCHYNTPYGPLVLGVYTHAIENGLTESGGNLYMKYTIDVNSCYLSDTEVFLSIRD
jgi:uncharacterized beta-barrel protein YwiB (DUF1934 family)